MDAETVKQAREPFFGTKDGRGLGLTVAYGIARQLGGELILYSEPGRGTSVKIYLPLADQALPGEAAGDPDVESSGTVLLAEDNAAVRMWTGQVLEVLGYSVLDAADGQEALALAESHDGPIDALVTDVVMPGIGGPELADKVRALRPEIGVLLVSGYTDRSVVERGLLRDGTAFLQKPFSTQDLSDSVRGVLPAAR
jgi:CheY-like chemotaxis protein